MSPEQWDRVKELYEAALECIPAQRRVFLKKNADDEIVRAEVHRLLSEHDNLGSFLSTPPFVDPHLNPVYSPERLAPGEVLAGRFRIANFIAAGGMGEVYRAEDLRLGRIVVLKFLPKELAEDRPSLERFRREAKAASALNHPNLCTVYDFGEDAGRAFIAMEYLEGDTLSVRIKEGPLPLEEALKIAMAIASGLGAAHRKGIVHRDLKPGNIMITDTAAKLLDFGLAKYEPPVVATEETITVVAGEAKVVGTLPYMSPEQLQGKEVDARGDIFAFGAVLYEMLTGRRAFQRQSNRETIAAVDGEEPKPLRELVKDVPDEVERIVRRCLRKDPEKRYASVSQIEQELQDCSALIAEPASGINLKVLLWQSKRPRVAIPVLFSLLMLVGLFAWWVHHSSRVRWARDQAVPQIAHLIEEEKLGEAYALAINAERYIPYDPMLLKFWDQISWSDAISTVPSGVSVYRRNYSAPDNTWEFLGRSPIEKRRFPLVDSRWKFEKEGYTTLERTTTVDRPTLTLGSVTIAMVEERQAPPGWSRSS